MIRISPYTPLFFNPSSDNCGLGSRYVQTFANTDKPMLQILASPTDTEPSVSVRNMVTGGTEHIILKKVDVGSDSVLYYHVFVLQSEAYYKVSVNGKESEMFFVTEDRNALENTVLLQYTNVNNKSTREAVFSIGNVPFFFDFRIPGGFRDNGWAFEAESEQFTTLDGDVVSMSAVASTQKMLTVGTGMGCPIWFGEHLNRLLCCDYVYVDGVRYSRKESSTPDITEVMECSRSFVFRQLLQEVKYIDNRLGNVSALLYRSAADDQRVANDDLRIC